jgi:hypothetical protein
MKPRLALSLAAGALFLGSGALAQPVLAPAYGLQQQMMNQAMQSQIDAQLDQATRREVIQQNDISRLDAQQRTDQALATLQAQGLRPRLLPAPAAGPPRQIDVSGLASIPDDRLAASDARVRAAAKNRR